MNEELYGNTTYNSEDRNNIAVQNGKYFPKNVVIILSLNDVFKESLTMWETFGVTLLME